MKIEKPSYRKVNFIIKNILIKNELKVFLFSCDAILDSILKNLHTERGASRTLCDTYHGDFRNNLWLKL